MLPLISSSMPPRFRTLRRRISIAALAIASAHADALSAQRASATDSPSDTRGVFVVARGTDTLAIESFERGTDFLTGEVKAPGRPWIRYRIEFDATSRASRVSVSVLPADRNSDADALQRVEAVVQGDSASLEVSGAAGSSTQRVHIGNAAQLIVGQSTAEIEHVLRAAKRTGTDSAEIPAYALLGGRMATMAVRFFATDSASITLGAKSMVHFDQQGRIARLLQAGGQVVVTRASVSTAQQSLAGQTYDAPPDAPYRAELVRVQSANGVVLAGTLTLPRVAPHVRLPAVVTISGSGPQDRDSYLPLGTGYRLFRQIADTLGRRGIAVLRLDDRGTGSSTGSFAAATETDFVADVQAAVEFLRARPDIDPSQIALLGHSEGGVIAPLAAAEDSRIAALVLMAGPADPRAAVMEQNRHSIAEQASLSAAQKDSVWRRVPAMLDSAAKSDSWFGGFLRYDGRATAARIKVPTLILQGDTDSQVPRAQAELYARFFIEGGNQRVTRVVFPNRNHLFLVDPDGSFAGYGQLPSMTVDQEVLGSIADWLAGVLNTTRTGRTER